MTLLGPAAEADHISVSALEILVNRQDSRCSPPSPEEGNRLLCSFLRIREPALRDAIVELVAAVALGKDRH
jgi:hypothetical protein